MISIELRLILILRYLIVGPKLVILNYISKVILILLIYNISILVNNKLSIYRVIISSLSFKVKI